MPGKVLRLVLPTLIGWVKARLAKPNEVRYLAVPLWKPWRDY